METNQRFSSGLHVAFDADGTLWPEDANHILLDYQHRNHLRDYEGFLEKYQSDQLRSQRCQIFAKRQAGFSLKEFQAQCRQALKEQALKIAPFQLRLLEFFKQHKARIYVVTASLRYLVEEALSQAKVSVDRVLGMESQVQDSRFTSKLIEPIPYGLGKKEAYLKESKAEPLFFMAGNTLSDLSLLELAEVSLVVSSALPDTENFESEQKLKKKALQKSWFHLQA